MRWPKDTINVLFHIFSDSPKHCGLTSTIRSESPDFFDQSKKKSRQNPEQTLQQHPRSPFKIVIEDSCQSSEDPQKMKILKSDTSVPILCKPSEKPSSLNDKKDLGKLKRRLKRKLKQGGDHNIINSQTTMDPLSDGSNTCKKIALEYHLEDKERVSTTSLTQFPDGLDDTRSDLLVNPSLVLERIDLTKFSKSLNLILPSSNDLES